MLVYFLPLRGIFKFAGTFGSRSNRWIIARRFNVLVNRSYALIPIVLDKTGLGERAFDIYSRLLKDRIVCLMGPVTDETSSLVLAQLLFLQSEDKHSPIHLYINSPGGVVTSGLAIYDTMQHILPPIHTWCIGQASSMGSLLLTAGTPGCRYALPHARIMVHQPSGSAQGQAVDIQIQAEEIVRTRKILNNLYAKHTKQPLKASFSFIIPIIDYLLILRLIFQSRYILNGKYF